MERDRKEERDGARTKREKTRRWSERGVKQQDGEMVTKKKAEQQTERV